MVDILGVKDSMLMRYIVSDIGPKYNDEGVLTDTSEVTADNIEPMMHAVKLAAMICNKSDKEGTFEESCKTIDAFMNGCNKQLEQLLTAIDLVSEQIKQAAAVKMTASKAKAYLVEHPESEYNEKDEGDEW